MRENGNDIFGLLCWNIQKRSLTQEFQREFAHLLKEYPSQIVALQEVKVAQGSIPGHFQHFWQAHSFNFTRSRHNFGVMTLSTLPILQQRPLKTRFKEVGVATRKSALLTYHKLSKQTKIALFNIHAINFVPYRLFAKELEKILERIEEVEERRLIVAGDFNTWSAKRERLLESALKEFDLEAIEPKNGGAGKSILGRVLDRIYYRALTPLLACVIETPVSDHNPIYASFTLD